MTTTRAYKGESATPLSCRPARTRQHGEGALKEIKELYEKGRQMWLGGMLPEALRSYESIIEMGYGSCDANLNAAVILTSLGRQDDAEAHFARAFASCPEDPQLLFNYSLHLLSKGEIDKGLELYETRDWNIRPPGKEWKGDDCGILLVAPEQGNGDIIQFSRYLPEAKKRCEKLIVMCFASLVRLISSMGVADEVIEFNPGDEFVESEGEAGDQVPYDRYTRIMSIPFLSRATRIDPKPYIKPDQKLVEEWSKRIEGGKPKVGICWKGGKRAKEDSAAIDARRSVSIETVAPILEVEGPTFYSLQKDAKENHPNLVDLMKDASDFAETAALIENLDLVITVDTAVAHLAGAMGKPVWLINRKDSCWRWGREGESTPWYSNMRIFRQKDMKDWVPVIDEIKEELKKI